MDSSQLCKKNFASKVANIDPKGSKIIKTDILNEVDISEMIDS